MFRVLIIDDEEHMRDTLAKLLARHCMQVNVIGSAEGVHSGIRAINLLHPDIVLLDIQMKDGTGFDLLAEFPSIDFKVIFITAFDQFAVQAFRFSAVDYLLKPVNPLLLAEAVNRAAHMIQDHFNLQVQALEENLKSIHKQQKKIIVKTTENIHLLELKNIISCESDSSYTTIRTTEGDAIMVSKSLKEYEELLSDCGFYRVHKSHLINLIHIKRFERQDGGSIVLTNDLKIPVASRKREEMLELLERMAE
jgi:two-component system, LytTR family, response regulator